MILPSEALDIVEFDTKELSTRSAAASWQAFAKDVFFDVEYTSIDLSEFSADARVVSNSDFTLAHFKTCGESRNRRTRRLISGGDKAPYAFDFVPKGQHVFSQFGEETCAEGGFVLIDPSEPFSQMRSGFTETYYLLVSREFVEDRFSDPQALCGRRLDASSGLAAAAAALMRSLTAERNALGADQFTRGCASLVDLLWSAFDGAPSNIVDEAAFERGVVRGELSRDLLPPRL